MTIALFYHSFLSDWNHGNAHFIRGIATELLARGYDVRLFEPANAWSLAHLMEEFGSSALDGFRKAYPGHEVTRYDPDSFDPVKALEGVDLALVHEWNEPQVIAAIGLYRRSHDHLKALFHDTHHRSVSSPDEMASIDLSGYDGVLAFGELIRRVYLERGWTDRAWTWHEAADTRIFYPRDRDPEGDLVWIGNWGDDERTAELHEFLLEPVRSLGLSAVVHGVRYPTAGRQALATAGIRYGGWLPNYRVPDTFARFRVTVHIPRRPYVEALPGIPTIRVFEALACGIPLITAPWEDVEGLFTPGEDYLVAQSGQEMRSLIRSLLDEPDRAAAMARTGLETIHARHTCSHRVDELLAVIDELSLPATDRTATSSISASA